VKAIRDEVLRLLAERAGRLVVGITGPPGAGKSTVARGLLDAIGPTAAYLPMDGFHLSNAQLDWLGRRDRKGAPDTFDAAGYVATLSRIAQDYGVDDVYVPDFHRVIDEPVAAGLVVRADARLVVTEGNYLAVSDDGWAPVRGLIDRLFYLDCPPEVRRSRLVRRQMAGGRSRIDAQRWVDGVDEPNAATIASTEADCDRTLYIDDAEDPR
jgi:pantothenate kinase